MLRAMSKLVHKDRGRKTAGEIWVVEWAEDGDIMYQKECACSTQKVAVSKVKKYKKEDYRNGRKIEYIMAKYRKNDIAWEDLPFHYV